MKIIGLLLIIVLLSGCGDKIVVIETKEPTNLNKEPQEYTMGQKVLIDGLSYKVDMIESYSEIGKNSVSQRAEGIFYLVYLNVENIDIDEGYVFSPSITLVDGNEKGHSPDLKAKFYIDGIIEWEKRISLGDSHKGILVFDLPLNSKELKLKVRNDWEDVSKVFIKIPDGMIIDKGIMQKVLDARESEGLSPRIG
jgi:hypothetical protein